MEEGLGALGFWIFLGLIVAAGTISEGLKERDKERDKQATLRALLEKEGQSATEVLAYLRERDAAVAEAAARAEAFGRVFWIKLKAIALVVAIGAGTFAFAAVVFGIFGAFGSELVAVIAGSVIVGVWATGLVFARRIWRSAKQQNDAHPDA